MPHCPPCLRTPSDLACLRSLSCVRGILPAFGNGNHHCSKRQLITRGVPACFVFCVAVARYKVFGNNLPGNFVNKSSKLPDFGNIGGICASPDGLTFDGAHCSWLQINHSHWDTWPVQSATRDAPPFLPRTDGGDTVMEEPAAAISISADVRVVCR